MEKKISKQISKNEKQNKKLENLIKNTTDLNQLLLNPELKNLSIDHLLF